LGYIGGMLPLPLSLPVRLWLLPHAHHERGEPAIRPVLATVLDCAADELPLVRDALGRPQLAAPFEHYDTNWSHSGEALLLALGESMELGVDIEQLRPRPRARELAQRFFHPDEVAWLDTQAEDAKVLSFVRLWCAKEAVLKAHGKGVSFGLEKLVFVEDDNHLRLAACDPALGIPADWTLHEWTPLDGYRAAVAWRPVTQV
jgi:4'-phosphopantetheinyl transferase